jgi:AcrR family transcriptional regulator
MATSKRTPATTRTPRPAHRPSRRADIINAALSLFVRSPYDDVTVAEIAALADLTPAAVHYHFDGKEQILLEAIRTFSDELLGVAQRLVDAGAGIETIIDALLALIRSRRTAATVFFVSSVGLNLTFEAHRKLVRAELAELFAIAARTQFTTKRKPAEAMVVGAAAVSILEVTATSILRNDDTVKQLGARRTSEVVSSIVSRLLN